MELDTSVESKILDLAIDERDRPYFSGAVTLEIKDDVYNRVMYPLHPTGLEWCGWSERSERSHLQEAWGDGYGN